MKEKSEQWKEKNKVGKWFQRDNLIIIILSGILLLIVALPVKQTDGKETSEDNGSVHGNVGNDVIVLDKENGVHNVMKEYENTLEKRLCEILEKMEGAGKVEVMITFSASQELVVEKDRPIVRVNTTENDGEGGTRSIYETDSKENTIYKSDGNVSEPYVVKTLMPRVEGILVAAQGAGKGEVTKTITEAVQALFDLDVHKIKVIRMKGTS